MRAATRATFIGVLFLSQASLACISTNDSPPDDISGDWHGSYTDNTASHNTGTIDATFTESGTTLGGSLTLTWGCAVANSASVSGTIDGDTFNATMVYGFTTVTITGTRSGESVSGTFSISGGICNGDTGSYTLSR